MLRLLADRRDELTSERRRTINRLHRHLRDLIAGGAPTQLNAKQAAALLAKVRPRDGVESERKQMARDLLVDVRRLDRALAQNRRRCAAAVAASGTSLCDLAGISDVLAAKILGHIGDIGRFPSADRLASYAGTAPIEASSGEVVRHRLSRNGNRQLNHAIHLAAHTQDHPPRPRTRLPTSADATPATAATKPSDSSNDNSPKPSTAPSSPTPTAPAKTPRLDIEALSGHVRPTGRCAPRGRAGPTDHSEGTRRASRGKGQTQPHRQSTPSMSVVVLGQLAGLVEVAEPPEGVEGAVVVVGGVEAVELLECLPAGFEAGVGVEQLVEAGAVGVGEGVASAQQREPGLEHLGVEGGLDAFGLSALHVAADLGEPGREPSDDVEAVQHMAGVAEVGRRWPPCRPAIRR